MLKRFLKNQRGLTLVELLAVIVILGIIAAIAVPSIGGIINKTKDDAKVAEAVQIIGAAKLAHATKANTTAWSYGGTGYTAGTDTTDTDDDDANYTGSSYKYGPKLSDYLDNVEDNSFVVIYEDKTYKIIGHEVATVLGKTSVYKVTEEDLLRHTNGE